MTINLTIDSWSDGYTWEIKTDGVKARGYTHTYVGAWHAARRREKKIRKLQRTLDVRSLMEPDIR